ncbi:MAG: cell wall-active antibiotics response protein [Marinifilaceae bacterium]|jgi:hypothetical protein|nr:cell wall-active antibiotics response protein [Marinifilaceae bacterium]
MGTEKCRKHNSDVVLGIVFIIVGVMIGLRYLDIQSQFINKFLLCWQTLLILVGILISVISRKRISGTVLIMIGSLFLLPKIFEFAVNLHKFLWPSLFVLLGGLIIFKHMKYKNMIKMQKDLNNYLNEFIILGGRERIVRSNNFQGGKTTAILGGLDLDLTEVDIKDDIVVIEASAFLGGCSFVVSPDWDVRVSTLQFIGGVTDRRVVSPMNKDKKVKKLIISGAVILGGIEVKTK